MLNLTETIYVKYNFSDKELLDYSRKMARAESTISEKSDELKSMVASVKAEIAEQEAVLHNCAEKLRSGYEMRKRECDLKYDSGLAKYFDRATGEMLEERPLTPTEQLKLSGKWVDAEQVIRADNEKQEAEDTEDE